jgi:transcription elongation factor GreA
MIRNAKVIKDSDITKNVVSLGCKVKIEDMETHDQEEYTVVGTTEADPMADPPRISNESPVGKAILNQKVGSVVKVRTPVGELDYKIVAVSRPTGKKKAAAKESK